MQMIQAGIKGNTPARKLVLEFIGGERRARAAKRREEKAKAAIEGGVGVLQLGCGQGANAPIS